MELRHPRAPALVIDSPLQRALGRALERLAGAIGVVPARAIAAAFVRLGARTDRGYAKGLFRVAARLPAPMPRLWRVPPAWWAAEPRVRARRLGLDLELDLRDNLQRTLWFTGTYEPGLLALLADELRPGDVVADVGAHVGVHSLSAARRLRELGGGGRVIAFEPAPDSAATLRAAALRNGLPVEVVESALGEAEGEIELLGDPRYSTHDAGVRSQFGAGEVIARAPVTTFDAWAADALLERLDVVKVDIEGAEILALRGMREALTTLRPRLLAIEVKDVVMERGPGDEASLHALLRACGYAPAGSPERHVALFRPRP